MSFNLLEMRLFVDRRSGVAAKLIVQPDAHDIVSKVRVGGTAPVRGERLGLGVRVLGFKKIAANGLRVSTDPRST